jgi:hypothetical protein
MLGRENLARCDEHPGTDGSPENPPAGLVSECLEFADERSISLEQNLKFAPVHAQRLRVQTQLIEQPSPEGEGFAVD